MASVNASAFLSFFSKGVLLVRSDNNQRGDRSDKVVLHGQRQRLCLLVLLQQLLDVEESVQTLKELLSFALFHVGNRWNAVERINDRRAARILYNLRLPQARVNDNVIQVLGSSFIGCDTNCERSACLAEKFPNNHILIPFEQGSNLTIAEAGVVHQASHIVKLEVGHHRARDLSVEVFQLERSIGTLVDTLCKGVRCK